MSQATKRSKQEPYQLSLARPADRFTDKEWQRELKSRIARNKQYAISYKLYGGK